VQEVSSSSYETDVHLYNSTLVETCNLGFTECVTNGKLKFDVDAHATWADCFTSWLVSGLTALPKALPKVGKLCLKLCLNLCLISAQVFC